MILSEQRACSAVALSFTLWWARLPAAQGRRAIRQGFGRRDTGRVVRQPDRTGSAATTRQVVQNFGIRPSAALRGPCSHNKMYVRTSARPRPEARSPPRAILRTPNARAEKISGIAKRYQRRSKGRARCRRAARRSGGRAWSPPPSPRRRGPVRRPRPRCGSFRHRTARASRSIGFGRISRRSPEGCRPSPPDPAARRRRRSRLPRCDPRLERGVRGETAHHLEKSLHHWNHGRSRDRPVRRRHAGPVQIVAAPVGA